MKISSLEYAVVLHFSEIYLSISVGLKFRIRTLTLKNQTRICKKELNPFYGTRTNPGQTEPRLEICVRP